MPSVLHTLDIVIPYQFPTSYLSKDQQLLMDSDGVESLMLTVNSINASLDVSPISWRDHLQTIRSITVSLDFRDPSPDEARKRWQLPLIWILQRVAFADADNGCVQDIADWCLRQSLVLIQLYPTDANILECKLPYWRYYTH